MRKITREQAEAVFQVLVAEAGVRDTPDGRDYFVHSVSQRTNPTEEFTFGGRLGSGGKFRNGSRHDHGPFVDCYPEHLNEERKEIIRRTNAALDLIFRLS